MKRFLALLLSALMVLSLLTACGSKSDETTPEHRHGSAGGRRRYIRPEH